MRAFFAEIPQDYFTTPVDDVAKIMIPSDKLNQLEVNLDDLSDEKKITELNLIIKSQVTVECHFIDFRNSFLEDKIQYIQQ